MKYEGALGAVWNLAKKIPHLKFGWAENRNSCALLVWLASLQLYCESPKLEIPL